MSKKKKPQFVVYKLVGFKVDTYLVECRLGRFKTLKEAEKFAAKWNHWLALHKD